MIFLETKRKKTARSFAFRRCPDGAASDAIEKASTSRLLLVQEIGPTCFVLCDESSRKFRVAIGQQQTCSCSPFSNPPRVCVHIAFVMHRIFRIPRENPLLWQVSLVDDEVEKILSGRAREIENRKRKPEPPASLDGSKEEGAEEDDGAAFLPLVPQKLIEQGETCAVCQEEMPHDSMTGITYCSLGCGNNFHALCMKRYAEHQVSIQKPILCPVSFSLRVRSASDAASIRTALQARVG